MREDGWLHTYQVWIRRVCFVPGTPGDVRDEWADVGDRRVVWHLVEPTPSPRRGTRPRESGPPDGRGAQRARSGKKGRGKERHEKGTKMEMKTKVVGTVETSDEGIERVRWTGSTGGPACTALGRQRAFDHAWSICPSGITVRDKPTKTSVSSSRRALGQLYLHRGAHSRKARERSA